MTSRSRMSASGTCLLFVVALSLILPRVPEAQPGTAPTGDPGGFGIDGDLDPGTPVAGTSDWMSFIMPNGTTTSPATLHGVDGFNSSDLAFTGGSSRLFADPNTSWFWDNSGMQNPVGGRENFSNGVAHFSRDASGHTWFTWAVDRMGGGGQSYMDVGLYQGGVVRNGNGTFSSVGPHGGHTVGDVVLSLELLDVNGVPILTAWRWTETGPGTYNLTSLMPAAGTFFSCANAGVVDVAYGAFGVNFYGVGRFAEASIDLTALLAAFPPSPSFQIVLFESRFGHEIESVLRDFIEPMTTLIATDVEPADVTATTRIWGITPNPARGSVRVEFELAQAGPVSLEFFDVAGRRVGSLAGATFPAGRHALRWEPKSTGARARGGILYARLVSQARSDVRRFVLMP